VHDDIHHDKKQRQQRLNLGIAEKEDLLVWDCKSKSWKEDENSNRATLTSEGIKYAFVPK
jgi:hypothetical protein